MPRRAHAPAAKNPGAGAPGAWHTLLPPGRAVTSTAAVDCKPSPVPARGHPRTGEDHSSRRPIAVALEHSHPDAGAHRALRTGHPQQRPYSSLLREGLAPPPVTRLSRVGSYPTISPLPVPPPRPRLANGGSMAIGGVVSAALSLGSPRVAVSDLPALWSPDFPPAAGSSDRRRSSVHLRLEDRLRSPPRAFQRAFLADSLN